MYRGHYQILQDAINLRCVDTWSANIKYRRERQHGFDLGDRRLSPENTLAIADAFRDAFEAFQHAKSKCAWWRAPAEIVNAVKAAFKMLDAAETLEARITRDAGKD